jgi:hypothetical protein
MSGDCAQDDLRDGSFTPTLIPANIITLGDDAAPTIGLIDAGMVGRRRRSCVSAPSIGWSPPCARTRTRSS